MIVTVTSLLLFTISMLYVYNKIKYEQLKTNYNILKKKL